MFGLGNSQVGIGLAISLHDRFTQNARKVSNEMNNMKRTALDTARANLGMMTAIGAGATRVAMGGLRYLKDATFNVAGKYEYNMLKVKAITEASVSEMEKLETAGRKVAKSTIFNNQQISKAFIELSRAGLSTQDQEKMIRPVANLAAATSTNIFRTAELATDMMTSMGLSANEANRAIDLMTVTANSSNLTFTQLGETMKYAGYNARLAGVSMEEVFSVTGALANAGLKGSTAGTTINNFLTKLTAAMSEFKTKRQASVLHAWGLEKGDVINQRTGQLKNLIEIMAVLKDKVKIGDAKAIAQIDALLGKRGGRAIVGAFDAKMGKSLPELYATLKDPKVAGTAQKIADTLMGGSLEGNSIMLANAWEDLKLTVGKTLIPLATVLIKGLTKVVNLIGIIADTKLGRLFIYGFTGAMVVLGVLGTIAMTVGGIGLALSSFPGTMGLFNKALQWSVALSGKLLQNVLRVKAGEFLSGPRKGQRYYKGPGGKFVGPGGGFSLGDLIGRGGGGLFKGFGKFRFLRMLAGLGRFGRLIFTVTRFLAPLISVISGLIPSMGAVAAILTGPVGWIVGLGAAAVAIFGFKDTMMFLWRGLQMIVQGIGWLWDHSILGMAWNAMTGQETKSWGDRMRGVDYRMLDPKEKAKYNSLAHYNKVRDYEEGIAGRSHYRDLSDNNMSLLMERMRLQQSGQGLSSAQVEAQARENVARQEAERQKQVQINIYEDGAQKRQEEVDESADINLWGD